MSLEHGDQGLLMKVGDIVVQGSRVFEMRKGGKKQESSKMIGTVITIHNTPYQMKESRNGDWSTLLGDHTIDVLWANGRLTENFAENSLEVLNDDKKDV